MAKVGVELDTINLERVGPEQGGAPVTIASDALLVPAHIALAPVNFTGLDLIAVGIVGEECPRVEQRLVVPDGLALRTLLVLHHFWQSKAQCAPCR